MANRISARIKKFWKERKNKNCITDEINYRTEIVIRCEKSFTIIELGAKKLDLRFSRRTEAPQLAVCFCCSFVWRYVPLERQVFSELHGVVELENHASQVGRC
jgi:hypothetical protein